MSTYAEVRGPAAGARSSHVAPASPGRPAWMTLVFACAAMLVSYLPFSAVNGVLGTIGTATGAGTGDLQWVTDAFTVALVGAVLSAGVLGDLYGRKRVALAGLGLTVRSKPPPSCFGQSGTSPTPTPPAARRISPS